MQRKRRFSVDAAPEEEVRYIHDWKQPRKRCKRTDAQQSASAPSPRDSSSTSSSRSSSAAVIPSPLFTSRSSRPITTTSAGPPSRLVPPARASSKAVQRSIREYNNDGRAPSSGPPGEAPAEESRAALRISPPGSVEQLVTVDPRQRQKILACLNSKNPVVVLRGPAGCGKFTAVSVLAKAVLGWEVWCWDEGESDSSLSSRFISFLTEVPTGWQGNKTLRMVKHFPTTLLNNEKDFCRDQLRQVVQLLPADSPPIVFLLGLSSSDDKIWLQQLEPLGAELLTMKGITRTQAVKLAAHVLNVNRISGSRAQRVISRFQAALAPVECQQTIGGRSGPTYDIPGCLILLSSVLCDLPVANGIMMPQRPSLLHAAAKVLSGKRLAVRPFGESKPLDRDGLSYSKFQNICAAQDRGCTFAVDPWDRLNRPGWRSFVESVASPLAAADWPSPELIEQSLWFDQKSLQLEDVVAAPLERAWQLPKTHRAPSYLDPWRLAGDMVASAAALETVLLENLFANLGQKDDADGLLDLAEALDTLSFIDSTVPVRASSPELRLSLIVRALNDSNCGPHGRFCAVEASKSARLRQQIQQKTLMFKDETQRLGSIPDVYSRVVGAMTLSEWINLIGLVERRSATTGESFHPIASTFSERFRAAAHNATKELRVVREDRIF